MWDRIPTPLWELLTGHFRNLNWRCLQYKVYFFLGLCKGWFSGDISSRYSFIWNCTSSPGTWNGHWLPGCAWTRSMEYLATSFWYKWLLPAIPGMHSHWIERSWSNMIQLPFHSDIPNVVSLFRYGKPSWFLSNPPDPIAKHSSFSPKAISWQASNGT